MKNMKKIGFLLLLSTIIVSCNQQSNISIENEGLINKYVIAVEQNDVATMESLLAEDYVGLGPSVNDSINKKGVIDNWQYNMTNLYESIHYQKSRIISVNVPDGENKGEWVSNWAELTIKENN